ncbi:hypothetical protein EVAR_59866_1 [Eumeta japonica]|uniref:Uncharacterized protein n=1 Tax=Eumeta variegata TaxID=151549 RepID=A0A4C1XNK0_EUMVA|nr:hypothetical protein EVAR_59866_1 [Eumeta japonica]
MAVQVEYVIHQSRVARSMLRSILRSHLPLRAKVALYKGYIHSWLTYRAPPWAPLNSSGTSHRRTRGRRAADPFPENSSKRLLPKTRTRLNARAGPYNLDPRKGPPYTRRTSGMRQQ